MPQAGADSKIRTGCLCSAPLVKSAHEEAAVPFAHFHDYAMLWTPEEYVFYVDGKEAWRIKAGGVSQVPEYILLTEEIGDWGGDIKKAELPDFCEVDYVRVYETSKAN